ncbi:MAG: signal peptidase II [Pseudomonadota bacterium]|nr:signal peptidase II [Pseudomonadota bacterium]
MQAPEPRSRMQTGLALATVTAGLDQTSKWAIMHILDLETLRRVEILPFLDFAFIWNYGISYGLFSSGSEAARWLLIGLTLGVTAYLARAMITTPGPITRFGYALIIGGALGNLADRIIHGAVVDFVSLHYAGYYWYVFNLADIWISLGVVLLVWGFWREPAPDA